ncbi:MAG TPA: biopolymer transporter ExbD [Flavobacterium sp.]|nr:biopolymer transporter ExbD [Flavobacterium sp.]
MAKAKITKKATSIDMTAMCDVSFLLLTFFILTSTAKIPEPLQVQTPSSTVQTKLPDTDLATITVGEEKAFFGVIGKDVRKRTLELMGEKYGVEFSDEEKERFSLIDAFGVPIDQLRGLIELNSSDRNKEGLQNGIPKDSLNNQLKDWVYNARVANIEKNKKELQFAIKGDAKEEYPTIKEIMDILQDQKINSFSLVTGLRGKDF